VFSFGLGLCASRALLMTDGQWPTPGSQQLAVKELAIGYRSLAIAPQVQRCR
jgi:hypothetical protein